MNSKAINIIRNFSYALSSNLVSLIVSTIVILIVPKLISVEEYGYWQLYLFYSSYIGFLHFGWNDGIYLRFGGAEYKNLDKRLFFSQFYMMVGLQLLISIIMSITAILLFEDVDRRFIIWMIAICLLIVNVRQMLSLILQSTNRIKEYASVTMSGRIIYVLVIILLLVVGIRDYQLLIVSDLIGKLFSLSLAIYYCKDIVFRKVFSYYFSFREAVRNTKVGIKLMIANIASTLIIGVVRFGIEHSWDIETFGKVSLTMSVSGLMIVFINAIGIVIFPILRRTDNAKLSQIYITIRDFLMFILLFFMIVYFPLKGFLLFWLPNYAESLMFMALIFPMIVYEGKTVLLLNTYFKTLRKEKVMLRINLFSLFISILTTLLTTILVKDLNLAVLSIVFIIAFRCILAEIILTSFLKINVYKDIILELVMSIIFIVLGWFMNIWVAVIGYLVAYVIYMLIKRKDITNTIQYIKLLTKA
ncbi:hypothetical protein V7200_23680 [Cytobacillus firmus]|uniref:O-antigen/teichoic acid export membrane protein n=1 Tax=Cytobacillus firmus TaxID=1399 RepID=A0A800MS07_CYTFI|nr:hypothetical protein [Cytobacillus firmus]KAF0821316.1 hypothetical protein KIS1582_4977 [Cytobacillus firmus]